MLDIFHFVFLLFCYVRRHSQTIEIQLLANDTGNNLVIAYYMWFSCFYFYPELSLAVPVANSLTFLCTLLTGKLLGEEFGGKRKWYYYKFG